MAEDVTLVLFEADEVKLNDEEVFFLAVEGVAFSNWLGLFLAEDGTLALFLAVEERLNDEDFFLAVEGALFSNRWDIFVTAEGIFVRFKADEELDDTNISMSLSLSAEQVPV